MQNFFIPFIIIYAHLGTCLISSAELPTVITTWSNLCFQKGTEVAWTTLQQTSSRLAAIVDGCSYLERVQCDGTIGYGGSPDELGRVTLDALIMDGPEHKVGAVAQLSKIKTASQVAWAVLNYSKNTLLVGDHADNFAIEMGFKATDLRTSKSEILWENWKMNNCQPNFRQNVVPDPLKSCGPYKPLKNNYQKRKHPDFNKMEEKFWHDTVGMLVVDKNGDMSAGTSTNGANHKIPGRVSDSALTGAGAYVDNEVGASASTGDGDVMQRFSSSFRTVENMRHGMNPNKAAAESIRKIAKFYPNFKGAIIAVTKTGKYGASCNGIGNFTYSVRNDSNDKVQLITVPCI